MKASVAGGLLVLIAAVAGPALAQPAEAPAAFGVAGRTTILDVHA
jgi:hypothetical protein